MSNALAIAHVTQALALLIEANLQPEIDMAVKVEPRKPPADPPTEPTITVFPYQVTPNTSQRNNDLPTRASDGTLLKRPAAALDVHFLISAYGEESELVGQRLIGSVVRTLHEIPVLPADVIELAGERPYLVGSDLAEAVQRVRFTPTVMDIDETSKLWGMLHQTPYTLSVVYQAALIFIEGREVPRSPRPVERHTVRVAPFGAPGAPERPGRSGPSPEPPSGPAAADTPEAEVPGTSPDESDTPRKAPATADAPAKAPAKRSAKKAASSSRATGGSRTTGGSGTSGTSRTPRPPRTRKRAQSDSDTDPGTGTGTGSDAES
ncbi:DUF4255 domain-containing protein [Streptomyces luteolus]|uniref:DUF4255 domain-containing protein n=1 Tax=Streptomyces luteolus TaxID=3043615 RepID=A0ABT6T054_9ACTN|nr:DUF4255 domain-containing protein [Streptomyces sp. B-S-A12]MDI3421229.1 DUF4255 domain-containing protein [Streptomyces sp. B-S-A12]